MFLLFLSRDCVEWTTPLCSRCHKAVMSRARDSQNAKSLRRRGAHRGLRNCGKYGGLDQSSRYLQISAQKRTHAEVECAAADSPGRQLFTPAAKKRLSENRRTFFLHPTYNACYYAAQVSSRIPVPMLGHTLTLSFRLRVRRLANKFSRAIIRPAEQTEYFE